CNCCDTTGATRTVGIGAGAALFGVDRTPGCCLSGALLLTRLQERITSATPPALIPSASFLRVIWRLLSPVLVAFCPSALHIVGVKRGGGATCRLLHDRKHHWQDNEDRQGRCRQPTNHRPA